MEDATAITETQPVALRRTSWRTRYPALARFTRSAVAVVALVGILAIILIAVLGPMVWHFDANTIDEELMGSPQGPSWTHPMGTDILGRDVMARVLVGARISLAVGIVSMLINLVIGVGIGTLAAWFGGWIDTVLMRMVDALYSIPILLIVIILQVFVKPLIEKAIPPDADVPLLLTPDLVSIYLALGVANWLTMARLSRSEVLNQKGRDYVSAIRSLGAGQPRILLRHVLPNSMAPLLVAATLAIPEAIFIESFLAFIGLGVSAPQASWGTLASDALQSLDVSPHLLIFPAIAISLTMLCFNLFGDGLRDALDPSASK
ncbi:ABC transporter permease [bacterium]|nr:ABC transporter permease [bacterium]